MEAEKLYLESRRRRRRSETETLEERYGERENSFQRKREEREREVVTRKRSKLSDSFHIGSLCCTSRVAWSLSDPQINGPEYFRFIFFFFSLSKQVNQKNTL